MLLQRLSAASRAAQGVGRTQHASWRKFSSSGQAQGSSNDGFFRQRLPLALALSLPFAVATSRASCSWWPWKQHEQGDSTGGVAAASKHDITLYQYQPCPFCNKVRAVLDYHKLPYTVVEVNPMRKKELEFSKDYKKVPIVVIDGEVHRDSVEIVDRLHTLMQHDGLAPAPRGPDESKWRDFIGERLIKLFSPNIYRTPSESLQAFDYIVEESNFSYWEQLAARYFGAAVMYLIGRRNKWKMGVQDERQALVETVDDWIQAGVGASKFHGGDTPSLTDLEVFGVLRALEGMTSTRDDLFSRSLVGPWYMRMKDAVGSDSRVNKAPALPA